MHSAWHEAILDLCFLQCILSLELKLYCIHNNQTLLWALFSRVPYLFNLFLHLKGNNYFFDFVYGMTQFVMASS